MKSWFDGWARTQIGSLLVACLAALPVTLATAPLTASAQDAQGCDFPTVIDLRTGTPSSAARLFGEVSITQLVFVGERHGTSEHVALARCILEAKTGSRPPVLALEHVPANHQSALDRWRRQSITDVNLFADLVDWEGLGWPDFFIYQPLIEQVGASRAHVVATDRPQPGAGGPSYDTLLQVAPDYGLQADEIIKAWQPDMIAAHCNLIDEQVATRMAMAQMERDQIMAGRLIAGRGRGPSTLYFGGKGHVRMDRAIPYLIARTDRPPSMLTVAAYTQEEWAAVLADGPVGQSGLSALYDMVVVTGQSAVSDADMCEQMRTMMGG